MKINLKVESSSTYYGKATFGNSDWLDATMSLVDYGGVVEGDLAGVGDQPVDELDLLAAPG